MTIDLPTCLPKLIVFDLDYTLWSTNVGATKGTPFTYNEDANTLTDVRNARHVKLFPDVTKIFSIIQSMPSTKIAIASRSNRPDWARDALALLRVPDLDCSLLDCIDFMEIHRGDKRIHLRNISEASGIPFNEMVFFDDEWQNQNVETIGVLYRRVEPKRGITLYDFKAALNLFQVKSRQSDAEAEAMAESNEGPGH